MYLLLLWVRRKFMNCRYPETEIKQYLTLPLNFNKISQLSYFFHEFSTHILELNRISSK